MKRYRDQDVQTGSYRIVTEQSQGSKVHIGNTVSNIVTTTYGSRWALNILAEIVFVNTLQILAL